MKKFLFPLIVLLVGAQSLLSQPDLQWIVVNGNGKSGTEAINEILINKYQNPINNSKFTLHGVRHPNRNDFPEAKNNIFILYEDGMHFNSRESWVERERNYPTDFFFREANNTGYRSHQFDANHQSPVKYMYLTNVYEEDDPPIGLSVHSGLAVNTPVSGTYEPDITIPQNAISATHDITRRKDVVLILSKKKLAQEGIDTLKPFRLVFNKIRDKTTSRFITNNYFQLSKIFEAGSNDNGSVFPNNAQITIEPSVDSIHLNANVSSPYIYINLRPRSILNDYFPQTDKGKPTHEAWFTVTQDLTTIVHKEDLVNSHDPNMVELTKVIINGGRTFLKYQIQFENTSQVPASELKVQLKFDDHYMLNTTKINRIQAGRNYRLYGQNPQYGQNAASSSLTHSFCTIGNGQTAEISFPGDWFVAAGRNRVNAIGHIELFIQVDQDQPWNNLSVSTRPLQCKVFFNDVPFYVDKFKDLKTKKGGRFYRPITENLSGYRQSLPGCTTSNSTSN